MWSDSGSSSADRNQPLAGQGPFEEAGYASTSDYSGSAYAQDKDAVPPKAAPDEAGYACVDEVAGAPMHQPAEDEAGYASVDMPSTTGRPGPRGARGASPVGAAPSPYAVTPCVTPGPTPGPTPHSTPGPTHGPTPGSTPGPTPGSTPGPGQILGPLGDTYSQVSPKPKGSNPSSPAGKDTDGCID